MAAKRLKLDSSADGGFATVANPSTVANRSTVADPLGGFGLDLFRDESFLFDSALRGGRFDDAVALLSTGRVDANGDVTFSGESRLNLAVRSDSLEVVRKMLELGVPIRDSYVALDRALSNGNCELVDLLIKYGADVNVRDENGRTLLHYHGQKNLWFYAQVLMTRRLDVSDVGLGSGVSSPIFDMISLYDARAVNIFLTLSELRVKGAGGYSNACEWSVLHLVLEKCCRKDGNYFPALSVLREVLRSSIAKRYVLCSSSVVIDIICRAPLPVLDSFFRMRAFELSRGWSFRDFVCVYGGLLRKAVAMDRFDIVRYVVKLAFGGADRDSADDGLELALYTAFDEVDLNFLDVLLRTDAHLLSRYKEWTRYVVYGDLRISRFVNKHVSCMRLLGEYEDVPLLDCGTTKFEVLPVTKSVLLELLDEPLGKEGSSRWSCPTMRQVLSRSNEHKLPRYARIDGLIDDLERLIDRFAHGSFSNLIRQRLHELKGHARRDDLLRAVTAYDERFRVFGSLLPDPYCVRLIFENLSIGELEEFLYRTYERPDRDSLTSSDAA